MANSKHFDKGNTGMYVSIQTVDSDVKRFIVPGQIRADGDKIYEFDFPEEFASGKIRITAITQDQHFIAYVHVK